MRGIYFAILFFIGVILQGGNILNYIALGDFNIKPDILITLLVYFAIRFDGIMAVIAAFMLGFAADIIMLPIGTFIITYVLAGTAISGMKKSSLIGSVIAQALLIFVTVFLILLASNGIKMIADKAVSDHFVYRSFATAVYSGLIAPFAIWVADLAAPLFGFKK